MWQDNQGKSVKRSVSLYEKNVLAKELGFNFKNALIFPGEPNTEIEELISIGFSAGNIFGIEREFTKAEILLDYYYDSIRIFCDEMNTFLAKSKNVFSYAHLDYCGHFNKNAAEDIINLAKKSTNDCFLRITFFDARRTQSQKDLEDTFWEQLSDLFLTIDTDLETWDFSWINKIALFSWFVKSYKDDINTVQDFFNLESLDVQHFRFDAIKPHILTYKEAESTTQMTTFFMRYKRYDYHLSYAGINHIIESLSQTPAYYLKPDSVGV